MMESRIKDDERVDYPDKPSTAGKKVRTRAERKDDQRIDKMARDAEKFLVDQSTNKTKLAEAARANEKLSQKSTMGKSTTSS